MIRHLHRAKSSYNIATSSKNMSPESRLVFDGQNAVRKCGLAYLLKREVEAMEYVREHTSIPIPKIFHACVDETLRSGEMVRDHYILMQIMPGKRLDKAWPQMADNARARTRRQLKGHLEELHSLTPPAGQPEVGTITGAGAYNHRSKRGPYLLPPYASVAEFESHLPDKIATRRPQLAAEFRQAFADRRAEDRGAHFAHGDLSWTNIFVDQSSGVVTGITDWETAGFWPDWWEFHMALLGDRDKRLWWVRIACDVLEKRQVERTLMIQMETALTEMEREDQRRALPRSRGRR